MSEILAQLKKKGNNDKYPKLVIISRVTAQSFFIDEDGTVTYYNNGITGDGVTFVYAGGGKWNVTSTTTRSIALRDLQSNYTVNLNLVANVQNSFTRDSSFACFL